MNKKLTDLEKLSEKQLEFLVETVKGLTESDKRIVSSLIKYDEMISELSKQLLFLYKFISFSLVVFVSVLLIVFIIQPFMTMTFDFWSGLSEGWQIFFAGIPVFMLLGVVDKIINKWIDQRWLDKIKVDDKLINKM